MGGVVGALAGFALLLWLISYFVPRFLRVASNGRMRLLFISAMAIIVLLNVFRRYRRRKAKIDAPRLRKTRGTP